MADFVRAATHPPCLQPCLETSDSPLPAVERTERVLTAPPTKARLRDVRLASRVRLASNPPRLDQDDDDSLLLERHHLFASTVKLAGHRFSCETSRVSQDWPAASTFSEPSAPLSARATLSHTYHGAGEGNSWGSAATAWRPPPKSARTSRECGSQGSPTSEQNSKTFEANFGSIASLASLAQTFDSKTDLLSTKSSGNRSHVSRIGVPIRHWLLPRQDAIPSAVTGRRRDAGGQFSETADPDIRIFIRLPGGNRFAVWVPPDMPVGPLPTSESVEDGDLSGSFQPRIGEESLITSGSNVVDTSQVERRGFSPCSSTGEHFSSNIMDTLGSLSSRSRKADGNLTPVRALLARTADSHYAELSDMFGGDDDFEISQASLVHGSLKDLIEAATGIPAKLQKLVVGTRGPLKDADKPICMYDVGHGAQLHLSIKHTGSRKAVQHLACTALKEQYAKSHDSGFLYENMGQFMKSNAMSQNGSRAAKDLVEPLPDWHVSMTHEPKSAMAISSELYYQDYTFLRDNHIFDLAGRIRQRFKALPRVAKSEAAPEHQKKVQEATKQCPVTGRRRSITETKGFAARASSKSFNRQTTRSTTPRDNPSAGRQASKQRLVKRETLEWVSMLQQERAFDDQHQYSVKRDPSSGFEVPAMTRSTSKAMASRH